MRKPVRLAFIILLSAAAVVALMLMLVQDGIVLKIQSAHGAEDPEHPAYIAALTTGNRYEVLTNGDQIFPSMLEAIRSARRRIAFETYIYKPGEMADQFTEAFEQAARRGVAVKIVLDAVGAMNIDRDHLQRLRDAGAEVVWFNVFAWYSFHEVNSRTHRKIYEYQPTMMHAKVLVVDGIWSMFGFRELRQPVAGAERRTERRGHRPGNSRSLPEGLRRRPEPRCAPRSAHLAAAAAALEGPRGLLERLRGGVLAGSAASSCSAVSSGYRTRRSSADGRHTAAATAADVHKRTAMGRVF